MKIVLSIIGIALLSGCATHRSVQLSPPSAIAQISQHSWGDGAALLDQNYLEITFPPGNPETAAFTGRGTVGAGVDGWTTRQQPDRVQPGDVRP